MTLNFIGVKATFLYYLTNNTPEPDILGFFPVCLEDGKMKLVELPLFFGVFRDLQCWTGIHTVEPFPYNHTCDGHTCDGSFTCDFTLDPRAGTCDAADPACGFTTFDAFTPTCNPMLPECRINNPGHCTAENYPTCQMGFVTCDPADPVCTTIDPAQPGCATPVEKTSWGQIKTLYGEE